MICFLHSHDHPFVPVYGLNVLLGDLEDIREAKPGISTEQEAFDNLVFLLSHIFFSYLVLNPM
jgi:hypothetical protein